MGLGKTLTLLSLIAFDKMKCGKKRSRSRVEMNSTLIVCPPSVISTWITQLEEHTNRGALKTYMYYGDRRTQDAEELRKYDIVLTTYATLGAELRCPDTPVKTLEWRRIVLDEAHTIKNVNAGQSQAVIGLNGKRRWAVTGTPIQNGSYDLFSLMAFLHFEPFSIKSYWQNLVQRPLTQGKQTGLSRLQVQFNNNVSIIGSFFACICRGLHTSTISFLLLREMNLNFSVIDYYYCRYWLVMFFL
jgi:SWI/SNF-related matrix-associated actin-dependent regulator of chromatin subfamily A3